MLQSTGVVRSLVLGDAVPKVLNLERQGTGGRLDYAPNVLWSIYEITVAVDDKLTRYVQGRAEGSLDWGVPAADELVIASA